MKRHGMNYRPLLLDGKIVTIGGAVRSRAWVCFWLWWVIKIELKEEKPCQKS